MDDVDRRIALALRPIKEFLAITVAELDRHLPGTIDNIAARADHPAMDLVTRSDDEQVIHDRLQMLVQRTREARGIDPT